MATHEQEIELHKNLATMAANMTHMSTNVLEIKAALPAIHARIDELEKTKSKYTTIGACASAGFMALIWVVEKLL